MEIANNIGKLYYVDEGFASILDKRVVWFLIEVDFTGGLLTALDIYWGTYSINK